MANDYKVAWPSVLMFFIHLALLDFSVHFSADDKILWYVRYCDHYIYFKPMQSIFFRLESFSTKSRRTHIRILTKGPGFRLIAPMEYFTLLLYWNQLQRHSYSIRENLNVNWNFQISLLIYCLFHNIYNYTKIDYLEIWWCKNQTIVG